MDCTPRYPNAVLDIANVNGDAFVLLSATTRCLLRAGASGSEILGFYADMTSGDYDYCLQAVRSMVRVKDSSVGT